MCDRYAELRKDYTEQIQSCIRLDKTIKTMEESISILREGVLNNEQFIHLKDNYKQIYELIAEQEDEQILKDTLDSINDALEDKADGYVAVIKSLETDNIAIDEEIKRLKQRKTSNENGIKRLKETLQQVMEETGKEKFKTALNSYSIANNPPSLDVTDESLIPKTILR